MTLFKESNATRTFNVGLLVTTLILFLLGVITLFSATKGPAIHGLYKTQLLWFGIGFLLSLGLVFVDSENIQKVTYLSFIFLSLLLLTVLFVGRIGGGSQRWLPVGPFHMQPSEFAKITLVLMLARYFSTERTGPPYTLKRLMIPSLLILPSFILILLQPDLGTAGVYLCIAATMMIFLGIQWKSLWVLFLAAAITLPVGYRFVLKDYQRDRVKTFMDPGRDARGTGYNAIQCKIAVGSGQFVGKGYLKGTQAQLNFIPEQHTDFIFSVFAEERGFLGCLLLLMLYMSYFYFALRSALRARDKFELLTALGLTSIVFWHVFINLGMVSGILPIVGVGLPFFSYGGSSLLTFMIATAILLNIGRRKYIF